MIMTLLPKHLLLSISLVVFSFLAYSHPDDNLEENTNNSRFKTLYLHTDRDNYFQKDTIWLKAYYLDAQTHQFTAGVYSMHVELINDKSEVINDKIWPISDGVAMGYLTIPDSLMQGEYLLRAYTDLLKQYGQDVFFHKSLNISKAYTEEEQKINSPGKINIDVAFLPEGGDLLANHNNIVALKAINSEGRAIDISGKVIDDDGNEIVQFKTSYQGMGKFILHPEKGKQYSVVINEFPNFSYEFNDVRDHAINLEFVRESKEELLFQAVSNTKMFLGSTFYFSITHRGSTIFQQKFTLAEKSFAIKVKKGALPTGINRFILLNKKLEPISERLYFFDNYQINQIDIQPDKVSYETRSEVNLELTDDVNFSTGNRSNLSMAIVDVVALDNDQTNFNIKSWLLFQSELKGRIEHPSDYFVDDEFLKSSYKLDLLMLTHGWSRYLWNEIPAIEKDANITEPQGLTLSGKVEQYWGKKGKAKVDIDLNIFNGYTLINENTKSNPDGSFRYDNLFFTDSAFLFIQARNKNNKLAWEIKIDSIPEEVPGIATSFIPDNLNNTNIQTELKSKQYYNEKAMKEFLLESGTILLDEVLVKGKREKKDDGLPRIYTKPAASFKIDKTSYGYRDALDFLTGRVPGMTTDGPIYIWGPSSFNYIPPMGLLDGMPVSLEVITSIPMAQIDVIEVIRGADAAIYGTMASNGIISVFTKKGIVDDYMLDYKPGELSKQIFGYPPYKEFYSPKYTAETIHSDRPDHRITLYWDPNITTEEGKGSVSFFTSDDIARYKILVEGLTEDGKICLGMSDLIVDVVRADQ